MLLPRRADPERHRRAARAAAPENLPPAGKRPSVRGDPRADQLPLRGLSGAGDRATAALWPEAGARDASEAVNRQAIDNKITLTADASALVKSLNQSQQELAELIGVDTASESEKIQQLRLQLSTRESELDQKTLELSEAKQKILDQAKRHQQRVDELKVEITQKPEPIMAELGSFTNTGFLVGNWRNSWKWISNWCFGLIVFFATTPIPPDLLMVLPEDVRTYLIAWTAFCGFVGRYLNQSKGVQSWPLKS